MSHTMKVILMGVALGLMGRVAGVKPWTADNAIWLACSFIITALTVGITEPRNG